MGKLIDFNKAKQDSESQKKANVKVKNRNEKLLKQMKSKDQGKSLKPLYFYVAILLIITIYVLVSQIQL